MKNLFPFIQTIHEQLTGWCSWHKAQTLASAVIALRPQVIVEIGVWGGKSFIPMAIAQQALDINGFCYAIDPWDAKASVQGQLNPADEEWWKEQGKHDFAHEQFQKFCRLAQVDHFVQVLKMSSDIAPVPENIGLLHCDGNHGEQALRDIQKFAFNVIPGGLVFLDDLQWTGGAVMQSAEALKALGFVELYTVDDPETRNKWGAYLRTAK